MTYDGDIDNELRTLNFQLFSLVIYSCAKRCLVLENCNVVCDDDLIITGPSKEADGDISGRRKVAGKLDVVGIFQILYN